MTGKLVAILRERPGQLVPYTELAQRLWPDADDYPSTPRARRHLRELVYRVRDAHADVGQIGVIATVPGHGYVWMSTS